MHAKSFLVRLFGHAATLVHGDTLVLDRWLWLRKRLYIATSGERLLDIGCGSGAFSIGAALRGYATLGLSWDERNQEVAIERAQLCGSHNAQFEVFDVTNLHERTDLFDTFDVIVCFETIEHILDDHKLLRDAARTLRPGGYLYMTTPYLRYVAMSKGDAGPFMPIEDGGHVRRGYTRAMLKELCDAAGLVLETQSSCSGLLSQKLTALQRRIGAVHPLLGWTLTLPLRIFPPFLDGLVTQCFNYPYYSICIEAYKPRVRALKSDR